MHVMKTIFRRGSACAFSLTLAAAAGLATHAPAVHAQRPPMGTATVSLTGEGIAVSGDYPTLLCGGPYMLGKGVAYQAKAGEWKITVGVETRASGKIPLNTPDGGLNVIVTATAPGKNFGRGPRHAGTLDISSDFRKADGTFVLRNVAGAGTVKLAVTFTCTAG